MTKIAHEIRDSIHNSITLNSDEREILNSIPVQRLRNIHQLAKCSAHRARETANETS